MLKKISLVSIALICLMALSVIYGLATITIGDTDNRESYSQETAVPTDNGKPNILDLTALPLDNSRPYKR